MNRFRTKKKTKDDVGSAPRPSQDSDSSMPFLPFRKGKKVQEEEKPEVDLTAALPSNDDFRTSLLMTGLSARFSMLREQDDPTSKLGKASDDSVLFPNRQSRMDSGAFRGLGDIAEVESIKAAAPFTRMDSFHSSDDTDSLKAGSVMSRSKPTEGNNLFGGRQKIYKIPAGINSSRGLDGGMTGRTLYDDDVSMSAFQKWRMAEKERKTEDDEDNEDDDVAKRQSDDMDGETLGVGSPFNREYNRNRETSSSLSSIPSMARNSTAATSIASTQPGSSIKDGHPSGTRTRRLYETGLNQDLQEQQTVALSRIDTLARQRTFGTRTPDLSTNSPSPTTTGFLDRFGGERKILTKASAPNLRSMSPPATASTIGSPDGGFRIPSLSENKGNFGGVPPLSPPISETDENSQMAIGPNDRGKATAMGVFARPSQPYDEGRYAERQRQRQEGRETPTLRSHDEPNTVESSNRSRSRSSVRQQPSSSQLRSAASPPRPTLQEAVAATFLADADDSETSPVASPKPTPSPRVLLRRPSDRQHPAFRGSALPTALSVGGKLGGEPSPAAEIPSASNTNAKDMSPADSPTLGPTTSASPGAGLSGMVRQHLRGDSNASSVYGAGPVTSGLESRFPADPENTRALHDFGANSNPWTMPDSVQDWNLDLDVTEPMPDIVPESGPFGSKLPTEVEARFRPKNRESSDEFASQLADGARRIRERLTTYVETDSRSSSPQRFGGQRDLADLPPPRSNGLGILRSRDSRGSLVDRGREPSKASKMLGVSPGGSQATSPARETMYEENDTDLRTTPHSDADNRSPAGGEESNTGLRAFRQARRELQRVRETESRQRHQQQAQGLPTIPPPRNPQMGHPALSPRTRSQSRDRKPPPVSYQGVPAGDMQHGRPRPDSRGTYRSDRERSGSETSNGTGSASRSRAGTGSASRERMQLGPPGGHAPPRPPMRSPGLPGTDIKRSPIMPPQPHPNAFPRMNQSNYASNGNLQAHPSRANESGQPSPVSPIPSPFLNSAPGTPGGMPASPRPPVPQSQSHDTGASVPGATRRRVNTREISDPIFQSSTSRVPTVELPPEAAQNRSRSNSRSAPPVPPINPRRRRDTSRTRTVLESLSRRRGDSNSSDATGSTPTLSTANSFSSFGAGREGRKNNSDEDDSKPERRRVRKPAPDSPDMTMNFRPRGHSPPVNMGPPVSRMVATAGDSRPGTAGMPGGMI
ncbi:hypothetical protein F4780DRAFT_263993 [Xylariomycetidae sp. FL0641]|nr:hypothetical protein F4780DRAFT_263993 [Xylariomycetidae sp. FL0641]